MSIESKHSYRFGYLQSDQWKNVRLDALVREHGLCQICSEESVFNDAHHVWYSENNYETKVEQLVVLCRPCHQFVHAMLPNCKTDNEQFGKHQWNTFCNALCLWRAQKLKLFANLDLDIESLFTAGPKTLRIQLAKVTRELAKANRELENIKGAAAAQKEAPSIVIDREIRHVFQIVRQWADFYRHSVNSVNSEFDVSDYQI